MPRERWAVPCSAHRSDGEPCSAYAITGGRVCVAHGGAAPQVKAAAARRWEFEQMFRRITRTISDPVTLAWVRAQFPADPATFRRHRRADDGSDWNPRSLVPNLALMAGQDADATA
jgi:hypothetical protein